MKNPMVIIEKVIPVPADIIRWAKSHSVPVINAGMISHSSANPRSASGSGIQEFTSASSIQEFTSGSSLQEFTSGFSTQESAPASDAPESNTFYKYDYVIEYSEDISTGYLNAAYCHAHNLPALIGATEHLLIREIGMTDLDSYLKILETYPEAVSDTSMLGQSRPEAEARHRAYMKYSYQFLGYGIWGLFYKPAAPITPASYAIPADSETSTIPTPPITITAPTASIFSPVPPFCDEPAVESNYPPASEHSDYHDKFCSNLPMIGIAGLDGTEVPSLSYAILPEYQGNGYAFEACKKIAEYAMDVCGLDKINISVCHDNHQSLKLAKKLKDSFPELFQIHIV